MDTKYIIAATSLISFIAGATLQHGVIQDLQDENLAYKTQITVLNVENDRLSSRYDNLVVHHADIEVAYNQLLRESKPEPTPTYISEAPLYDIPLSEVLQMYTYDVCQEYGVDYELALAVMWQESNFDATACSAGNYGLMQINQCNHARLKKELDIVDIMDPGSNILAGVYMLSESSKDCSNVNEALMNYSMGSVSASSKWRSGVHSTEYTKSVAEKYLLICGNQYPNQNKKK